MYCTQCGRQGAEGESTCPSCGQPFPPPEAPALVGASDSGGSPAAGPGAVTWGTGQVALGLVALTVAAVLVSLAAKWLGDQIGDYGPALTAWSASQMLGLTMLPVVWALGPRRWHGLLPALGMGSPRQPWPVAGAMTVGVLIVSLGATALYAKAVAWLGWKPLAPPEIPEDIVFPGLLAVLTFQALALWTPFTEELFFRGFVFGGLKSRWGAALSIVVSALIFSLLHLVPGVIAPVFLTGLLLAWLYHRTGSIWPCVAAHAGQNAIALAVTLYSD